MRFVQVIDTPLVEQATGGNSDAIAQLLSLQPMGRLGKSEEAAEAIAWLYSNQASFVTRHAMMIDGGFFAQ